MIPRILAMVLFLSACSVAGPTVIEEVRVPVKILKLFRVTSEGGEDVFEYSGKVEYDLKVGDFDSLDISLDFVPLGGGETITPYEITGAAGTRSMVNGINGRNDIFFKCKIVGKPADKYEARITIEANRSRVLAITDSLLKLMTNEEKVSQLHGLGQRWSATIPRLGIPGYAMSNGPGCVCVGVTGTSTSFPASSAQGCTFDTAVVYELGAALAKEYWAKGKYILEAPTINLVRDPRNGRAFETFSEDPFLCAVLSVAYCKGVQSTKAIAMPKHYVCNDKEAGRYISDSKVDERTLREIYAMPFEYSVKDAQAWSIMSAFNAVNGTWCSENSHILNDILKDEWGFKGFVVSDWGSLHSTAKCANAGQDVELCNSTYFGQALVNAVSLGQVSQERLDDMARRMLYGEVWSGVIGQIGPTGQVVPRYASDLKSEAHQQLAKRVAHESIVLVKNEAFGSETRPVLPLDDNQTVAVVGPYAKDARLSGGGSAQCCPHYSVSAYQGISERLSGSGTVTESWQGADVVIAVVGVSGEGEATERGTVTLEPPAGQNDLIRSILNAGKKCVVVMTGGTAATRDAWLDAPAVVVAWFPGEQQGHALADILFGDVNPSGKLSSTWPDEAGQLPQWNFPDNEVPYEAPDEGRGYRYFDKHDLKPCLAFGHGLSYTSFEYSNITVQPNPAYVGDEVTVTVDIRNVGDRAGDEVAQLYVHEESPDLPRPVKELRGFARVHLEPLDLKTVSFTVRERELAYFDDRSDANRFVAQPDNYTIMVGPSSADLPLEATLTLK